MAKVLLLRGLVFVVLSLLRGESLKRALWPLAWCAIAYVILRFRVTSMGGLRVFIGVAVLLLPWIIAPFIPRWRDRLRARREARNAATNGGQSLRR